MWKTVQNRNPNPGYADAIRALAETLRESEKSVGVLKMKQNEPWIRSLACTTIARMYGVKTLTVNRDLDAEMLA